MESVLKKFTDYVRYCYFHYTVITTVSMMEPMERYVFNAFFFVFFTLFIYTTVIFLPGHLLMMLHFGLNAAGLTTFGLGLAEEEEGGVVMGNTSS